MTNQPSPPLKIILAVTALVVIQFSVFMPVLKNEFLKYDDDIYVYKNSNIQSLKAENIAWMFARPYYRSYTPLALLSHAIDYGVWGNNPWGHHLTNLLLHSVNTILVFLLGLLVLRSIRTASVSRISGASGFPVPGGNMLDLGGAFAAALVFSLHPMRVESVAWVSDRKGPVAGDILSSLMHSLREV